MSGTSPDPREEFESSYGSRGTRGIRGGKSAKRKREAYLAWQESQGHDRSQVPVSQIGGQARPIGTSPLWEPESAQSDSEVAITLEQIVVPESDTRSAFEGAAVSSSSLSAPVSHETGSLRPRPSSRPSSSSSSSRLLTLTPKASSSSSSRVLPLTPKVRAAPPPAVRRSAVLHS